MLTLFDKNEPQGFRLDNFEFYNWGSFHRKIWSINPDGHSTLLTGGNGSGKTTLVDALVTLLVPTQMRVYNQSSGADKKRDRTELTYFLGTVGNLREENQSLSRTENLRDKSDYSIMVGNFSNSQMGKKISLGQIRWVSGNGLQRLFFSCDQALSLEKDILPFEATASLKKRLQREKNIRFYDNFKQYSLYFIKAFGLRSDKALNLFAQTVGVKVLGDLNGFIRNHMLEKTDTKSLFEGLYENYRNLLSTHRQIEKAEKQLQLLEPVMKSSQKVQKLHREIEEKELLRRFLPKLLLPYKQKALDLKKKEESDLKVQCENRIILLGEDLKHLEDYIFQVKQELEGNEVSGKIKLLEQDMVYLKEKKEQLKKQHDHYDRIAENLGISSAASLEDFLNNRKNLESLKDKNQREIETNKAKLFALKQESGDLNIKLKELVREIESLKLRRNNIPFYRIELRRRICDDLNISEEELPYAGELIRVREDQAQWRNSAEKVLHHFALCLLVPEKHYQQVNRYVNAHNLKGRLVYFRVNEKEKTHDSELWRQGVDENSLPEKLEVKPDSPFFGWVYNYLHLNYSYTCLNDVEDLARYPRAMTIQGLIKRDTRHEKDDRKEKMGPSSYVLGWDNQEKIRNLSKEYKDRKSNEEDLLRQLQKEEVNEDNLNSRSADLTRILEYENFNDLDWFRYENKLGTRQKELDELLSHSKDLQDLKNHQITLEKDKEQKKADYDREQQQIGSINANLQKIEEYGNNLTISKNNSEELKEDIDSLNVLIDPYLPDNRAIPFENWLVKEQEIGSKLTEQYEGLNDKYAVESKDLIRHMGVFLSPKGDILDQFPGWRGETSHLEAREEFISAFESYYKDLKTDGLPQYRREFQKFLNNRMQEDIIGFQESLDRDVRNIRKGIDVLNKSLSKLVYEKNPDSYIRLLGEETRDVSILKFKSDLKHARGDVAKLAVGDEAELESCFLRMQSLIIELKENEPLRQKVLDVRNWLEFAAEERYMEDHKQKQFYQDSHSLSGGEKAKLAYTILASAIAYQFGINDGGERSFRFVMVDEAFSKVDPENSAYAMDLFKNLNLQLMVVTPLDRINLVEDYIESVHYVDNRDQQSRIHKLTYTEYREKKKEWEQPDISQ
ncbi:MAG: SbcC/MukB-like Walker B domain-containing protein [Spirochaetaceae bacterium]|jgi:uncharacterized protein YPO0396|nr:SbcC/MukB-like Walker B domain-containing protein [Spirochaetaceae bacterium]